MTIWPTPSSTWRYSDGLSKLSSPSLSVIWYLNVPKRYSIKKDESIFDKKKVENNAIDYQSMVPTLVTRYRWKNQMMAMIISGVARRSAYFDMCCTSRGGFCWCWVITCYYLSLFHSATRNLWFIRYICLFFVYTNTFCFPLHLTK